MQATTFEKVIDLIEVRDHRYHREAYQFVREALGCVQAAIKLASPGRQADLTGRELLSGIRELALAQFGPMAMAVLEEWGIRSCGDFGQIVFNMVESGLLASSGPDCRTDFENGFDFDDAFRKPFRPLGGGANSGILPAPSGGRNR